MPGQIVQCLLIWFECSSSNVKASRQVHPDSSCLGSVYNELGLSEHLVTASRGVLLKTEWGLK